MATKAGRQLGVDYLPWQPNKNLPRWLVTDSHMQGEPGGTNCDKLVSALANPAAFAARVGVRSRAAIEARLDTQIDGLWCDDTVNYGAVNAKGTNPKTNQTVASKVRSAQCE